MHKALITFFVALFLIPTAAFAAIGITVAPIKYSYNVDTGAVIEDTIVVSNPNDFNLTVRPEFQNFKVTEGNNIQWIPNDIENPYSLIGWIEMNTSDVISLKPREEARIPFKIRVPKNASAGGHYGAVFFTGVQDNSGSNIGAVPRVGALIILNVNGNLQKSGKLLDVSGPIFANNGPVDFKATFLNTGTTHYETKLDVSVRNIFWKSGEFSSSQKFIYPNINRELVATWNKKALFGIYVAKASVTDGDGNVHEQTKFFVGLPYLYIIGIIILLLALYHLKRWFRNKFKIVRV